MAQHGTLSLMFFIAAIAVIGMPPFSGFIGKLFILEAARTGAQVALLWPLVLGTSFLVLISLSRAGSRIFWHNFTGKVGETRHARGQLTAISLLLVAIVGLTVYADPVSQFIGHIADELHHPAGYIEASFGGGVVYD